MCSLNKVIIACSLIILTATSASLFANETGHFGIGKKATPEEIAGWDIDIRPDGKGLPEGQGSVLKGEGLYEAKCSSCHGLFGEGEGRWPALAGGEDSLTEDRPEKTVGSFWPYASTLWDYINRAMPFTSPKTLTTNEVYAITAYVLYLNDLVEEDFVLTQNNLASIKMPNEENFYIDNRPDTNNKRCMNNCKDPSKIIVVHSLQGITPELQEKESTEEQKPLLSDQAIKGKAIYATSCSICHTSGVAGAPKVGDTAMWETRLKQGKDTLVKHATQGFQGTTGVMPAKGGNLTLTDDQVKNAVQYMVEAK